jgi:hypothetical protein
MTDPTAGPTDEALAQRLARELPRYTAPPSLRAAVVGALRPAPPRRATWLAPVAAAAAASLVLGLVGLTRLPVGAPLDPVRALVRASVNEHARALMWGPRQGEFVPVASPWLAEETGVVLSRVFPGDDMLTFIVAEPVYLNRTRGVAVHYRDRDGHLVTYIAVPAARITVPDRQRLPIDRFRPALLRDEGFVSWLWKQGDLTCLLVSDLVSRGELDRFKDYFVRVRTAMDAYPAY